MEFDDNASEVTVGSVISLASLEDDALFQGRKRNKKKSKRDQSPYSSQQFPGNSLGRSLGKTTGHGAWSAAIRNGPTAFTSENTPSNRWAHARGLVKKTKVSSDRRGGSSGGPFSRDEHILSSGKPAYKSPEDYYDEVMELKQVIKQLKADNGVMKTKLQRITQENVLKDRQIKDFLNPNKQPDEIRRTLTDRKADSSAVVTSLKQKLHLMERNVKDKESELRKLKTNLKSTNMEELRIQSETYFQETQRLQSVLSSVYSQAPGTRTLPRSSMLSSRMSSRENSPRGVGHGEIDHDRLENILEENRKLQSENRGLKKDLLCAMERPQKGTKDKNIDYADMNRVQMLRKITELEQLIEDAESKPKNSEKKESPESGRKKKDRDDIELELSKQRVTIENLKQDRSHYRDEADRLRLELRKAHEEIDQLKEDINKANELKSNTPPKPLPRQKSRLSTAKKSISFRMDKNDSRDELEQDRAARTLQRNWRRYNKQRTSREDEKFTMRSSKENEDLSNAAIQIQSILRGHAVRRRRVNELAADQDEEPGNEEMDYDEAVIRVQSALRAHHSRRKHFKSADSHRFEDSENEDKKRWMVSGSDRLSNRSNTTKQNTFTQRKSSGSSFLNKLKRTDMEKERKQFNNDDDDSDDDVVIGGSRSQLRKPKDVVRTRAEPSSRKLSSDNEKSRPSPSRGFKLSSGDSDDDVYTPGRSQKHSSAAKSEKNGFVFGKSSKIKEVEETKSTFFGRGINNEVDANNGTEGINKESALDSLLSPSRPVRSSFDHHEVAKNDNKDLVMNDKTSNKPVENKKKSFFSWGSSNNKKSKETTQSIRSKATSIGKKNNPKQPDSVWASKPSEIVDDDDDDDDDVVVTPKITRRTPTKTASLLDELF